MKSLSKKVKFGAMLNLLFLVATYFLCYSVMPEDISGVSKEDVAESALTMLCGTVTLAIQGVTGVFMFHAALKMKKTQYTENIIAALLVNILLSFIQMAVMFEIKLTVFEHGSFVKSDMVKIKILEQQISTGKMISLLLVVFYFAMLFMITHKSKKQNVLGYSGGILYCMECDSESQ